MAIHTKHNTTMRNTRWKNSLTVKFTFVQFVVAALIIASSTWFIFTAEKKHHIDTQLSLSQSYAHAVIAQLQQVTSKVETLARSLGTVGETYQGQAAQINKLIPPLLTMEDDQQLIVSGGIWPEPQKASGEASLNGFFWAKDDTQHFRQVDGYNQTGAGPSYDKTSWYTPAKYLQDSHTHWSQSYIDPYTQQLMITATIPMRVNHQFIGAASVDMALSGIDKQFTFSDQNPLSKGYIIALDAYNNLLSDPFKNHANESQHLGKSFTNLVSHYPALAPLGAAIEQMDKQFYQHVMAKPAYQSAQLQPLLDHTAKAQHDRLVAVINASLQPKAIKQSVVTLELDSGPLLNKPVLISILTMEETLWKIILVTPISGLSQQANAIAVKVGAFLLLSQLVALIILFIFQHKLFIRPIFQISSALQSGNLGWLALDANARQDEIGQLAKAFVARSNQLEIAYASLDASNLALEQQLSMQQQAQAELENKKELINSLLNASQNLICIKDMSGRYTLVNDKFCEILGLEREQILGAKDSDIYPPHIAEIVAHHDAIIKNNDNAQSFEQPIPTIHGELTYLVTKYPINDADGNLMALGAMAMDISSLKSRQLELDTRIQILAQQNAQLQQALNLAQQQNQLQTTATTANRHNFAANNSSIATANSEHEQQQLLLHLVQQLNKQQLIALEHLFTRLQRIATGATNQNDTNEHLIDELAEQIDILRHTQPLLLNEHQETKSIQIEQYLQDMLAMLAPQMKQKQVQWQVNSEQSLAVSLPSWHLFYLSYRLINNTLVHAFPNEVPFDNPKTLHLAVSYQEGKLTITLRDNGIGLSSSALTKLQAQLTNHEGYGTLVALNRWLATHYEGEISITSLARQFTEIRCQIPLSGQQIHCS